MALSRDTCLFEYFDNEDIRSLLGILVILATYVYDGISIHKYSDYIQTFNILESTQKGVNKSKILINKIYFFFSFLKISGT